MSINYAFGFSLFLLVLVALNIFFFYALNSGGLKSHNFNLPIISVDLTTTIFKEIYDHLNYLPNQYKTVNSKFAPHQNILLNSFNISKIVNTETIWNETENWFSEDSLFPHENGTGGKILHAIQTKQIALVDNAPKGTQLKLLLLLEGKQKVYFKPKRYNLNHVVNGHICAGFDRHNSEVFAYYLAMVLNFRWISPSVIRKIHLHRDVIPFATKGLKNSMIKNGDSLCIYGTCFYCKKNETVCPDKKGKIEGAAILYLDKKLKIRVSPWRRSYSNKKMKWEVDNAFCKNVKSSLSTKLLLNMIDVAVFDFLIQNGDRHHFEVYRDKIVLLDNGKGLGNPTVDELNILAPLYQCCMISASTWQKLEMVSGGSLTKMIKLLAALHGQRLATEEHFQAVERRLLKVYATVQYCIGKYGRGKVIKNWLI
ncbi:glycosaminoglycan xylosylkinase homolog [Melitaea cinxia]|uniref:glycosaminoglycan xylosylkinase homolog n=1 Tax=Melitaea cinxia TaxID=113334 RepID=UPI001E272E25|nr:glycosaminoglycan xylosylkinase homolog [Melitaea cinxia]